MLQSIERAMVGDLKSVRLSQTFLEDSTYTVSWQLYDAHNRLWNHGEAATVKKEAHQFQPNGFIISAELDIAIPKEMPASSDGASAQLHWLIKNDRGNVTTVIENFLVFTATYESPGENDTVVLYGQNIVVSRHLPNATGAVTFSIYSSNSPLLSDVTIVKNEQGMYYKNIGKMPNMGASLDPYTVVWTYNEGNNPIQEISYVYVVNPTMLDTTKQMEQFLNRAYIDNGIQPSTTFTIQDYLSYLRQGRDQFNAAVKPTSFTMTAANGAIHWFWMGYSCWSACKAQYMAEGMKSFNYSGQTVSLDVDRAPFWDAMADSIMTQLNDAVKPFKDNLAKTGVTGGDGSNVTGRVSVGVVGVTVHPLSRGTGFGGTARGTYPFTTRWI